MISTGFFTDGEAQVGVFFTDGTAQFFGVFFTDGAAQGCFVFLLTARLRLYTARPRFFTEKGFTSCGKGFNITWCAPKFFIVWSELWPTLGFHSRFKSSEIAFLNSLVVGVEQLKESQFSN